MSMHQYGFDGWMLGWGVGLAFHYVDVFGIPGFDILSKEWEDREIERELRQNSQAQNPIKTSNNRTAPPKPIEDEGSLSLKELRKNYDDSDFV